MLILLFCMAPAVTLSYYVISPYPPDFRAECALTARTTHGIRRDILDLGVTLSLLLDLYVARFLEIYSQGFRTSPSHWLIRILSEMVVWYSKTTYITLQISGEEVDSSKAIERIRKEDLSLGKSFLNELVWLAFYIACGFQMLYRDWHVGGARLGSWGFGQITAVVLLAIPLNALADAYLGKSL